MTPNNELITRLEKDCFTLDPRDVLSTPRAQEAFRSRQQDAAHLLAVLRNPDLDKPMQQLADFEAQRAAHVEKKLDLIKQHDEAPDPSVIKDARERDKAADHIWHLQQQLRRLADGTLLSAPGVTYERVEYPRRADRGGEQEDRVLACATRCCGGTGRSTAG